MRLSSALVFCLLTIAVSALNQRPIIGILTQPASSHMRQWGDSYIAASYVKYVESGGARVVPIFYNSTETEFNEVFSQVNGILFPGGATYLNDTQFYKAGKYLYDLALKSNDEGKFFPLFGHCLGFELLSVISSGDHEILESVVLKNTSVPLNFTSMVYRSKLFHGVSGKVLQLLSSNPVTMNSHKFGISLKKWEENSNLSNFYDIISTNYDINGVNFVSTVEAKQYPIYGFQWHPEKNAFEWNPRYNINHSQAAVLAMQYMANFMVSEARKSDSHFCEYELELTKLIYNYNPIYTGILNKTFTQVFIF